MFVEVDDAVATAMQQNGIQFKDITGKVKSAADVEATWTKLLAGPDRAKLLEAIKAAYPDAVIPELDAAKPILDEVGKVRKEFEEYKTAQEEREEKRRTEQREAAANDTVSKGRTWLRTDCQLDDEGVKAVEQIMLDEGIQSYKVAFNHWKAQQPPPAEPLPSAHGGARSLDWFRVEEDKPDHKLLITDPKAFQRQETGRVLQEIREGRLAA